MKYQRLVLLMVLASLLVTSLNFLGCSERSLKGREIAPEPPRVSWAYVQIDPIFHRSANLRWFSTDKDGVVLDYQFTVLLETTVDSLVGPAVDTLFAPDSAAARLGREPSLAQWTIVHTDSATIPLFASPDTGEYVPQHVFLRAMDDDSLFSLVIHRELYRNNHPPTCYGVVPWVGSAVHGYPEQQWCLPETTATWHGIRVAWVGKDSIDIPGLAPDFDWNVRIYGPFADSVHCYRDPNSHPPDPDTLPGSLHIEFTDTTGSVWIRDKQKYLTNMETGWYLLYPRNRDDAMVSSIPDSTTWRFLNIYEPAWIRHPELTKPILLANHTKFPNRLSFADLGPAYRDSVKQFYINLITSAGYDPAQFDWIDYSDSIAGELEIPKSDLYNHRLVIALDTDWSVSLSDGPGRMQETPYMKYLDVGGMLWLIGRRSFEQASEAGRREFGLSTHPLAYTYFNLSAVITQAVDFAQAEFAGATPNQTDFPNLPDLPVDTVRVHQTSYGPFQYWHGLFGVDHLIRFNDSQTLYTFRAVYPDTSQFHSFPVAIRWDKGTWKTSYFAFPLYFIQTEQAMAITQQMLGWFFEGTR